MFNNVDLIGCEAVSNMLIQTQLKRFVIYRQGAAKGSTPVYDCTYTSNNAAAVKNFKDWASNIMQYNPNNFLCYDILVFNDFEEGLGDPQNRNTNDDNQSGRKKGKIRFSFSLNGSMQSQNQNQNFNPHAGIDIAGEIQKGIEMAMLKHEVKTLREQIKEMEEEEDDDDNDGRGGDILGSIMSAIKLSKEENEAAAVNKDFDNSMSEDKTKKNLHNFTDSEVKEKTENVNKALKILWSADKNLDKDLLILAKLAKEDKIVFDLMIGKLRNL